MNTDAALGVETNLGTTMPAIDRGPISCCNVDTFGALSIRRLCFVLRSKVCIALMALFVSRNYAIESDDVQVIGIHKLISTFEESFFSFGVGFTSKHNYDIDFSLYETGDMLRGE